LSPASARATCSSKPLRGRLIGAIIAQFHCSWYLLTGSQVGIFYPTRLKEDTMSNLIQRFKEDLQLAGYAKRSIDSYVSSVLRLQRFYNKPLEDISEEQLRQYWL
jgi:hypothetical protein